METIQIEIADKRYDVLLAVTEEEKEQGLQNVEEMDENEGCLFDYSNNPQESIDFWMKNTLIPLDIIFIGTDGEVISVKKGEPLSEELITETNGPIAYVLELNINSGIEEGDELELEEDEDDEKKAMYVIGPDGKIMLKLEGGERIFSRVHTKTLLKKAKRAFKSKSDSDYKSLGKYMFKCIHKQNTQEQEYVNSPEK